MAQPQSQSQAQPLHLVTQDGQPYGSVRRCCERCGVMCWTGKSPPTVCWTDNEETWLAAPDNCWAVEEQLHGS